MKRWKEWKFSLCINKTHSEKLIKSGSASENSYRNYLHSQVGEKIYEL
jgi:hypothetical protein